MMFSGYVLGFELLSCEFTRVGMKGLRAPTMGRLSTGAMDKIPVVSGSSWLFLLHQLLSLAPELSVQSGASNLLALNDSSNRLD
jgi:hypothetical protein